MPLDVQPLSPTRRTVMLLVLLALFGASVGFAQLLVSRSHHAPKIAWNFPAEFKPIALDPDEPDEVEIRALGNISGRERLLRGIILDLPEPLSPAQQLTLLRELFQGIAGTTPANTRPAPISGRPGLELDGLSDTGEFNCLRMLVIQNRAVAICYSGDGPLTDWDKLYFNNVCQHVSLQVEPPAKRK